MHVDQNRRHEGKPGVGDCVGRLHPPPGSVYIQQFVNRPREIAEMPQTRAQTQGEQRYFGAANAVAAVDHQAKVKVQSCAGGESDELENLKRRESLRLRDVRNKQKQDCLMKERHCGLRIADCGLLCLATEPQSHRAEREKRLSRQYLFLSFSVALWLCG